MGEFRSILERAAARHGGMAGLEAVLPQAKDEAALKATGDDRYLSLMSLRIFRAGLKHSLVDAKWPAFEEAFGGFDPRRVRAMSEEEVERLMSDARLIRHFGKLRAVHANAAAMVQVAGEAGSFGAWLAAWPSSDVVGLWGELAKRFQQMGGNSGPYFLRMAGKDSFILSPDVVRGLTELGVLEGKPTGRKALAAAQARFNRWAEETGRPLCQLSMILARSVG